MDDNEPADTVPDVTDVPATRIVTDILYCPICTAPAEFCEFGPSVKRCKAWLTEKHPALVAKYYKEAAVVPAAGSADVATSGLEAGVEELSVNNSSANSGSTAAATKKPEVEKLDALQKEDLKREKKRKEAKVTIKRVERTKRKCTIVVSGLELFDVDLKKAAKLFATKFACGSSVTKNPAGLDEIVVQGDLQEDIFDLIRKTWKEIPQLSIDMD